MKYFYVYYSYEEFGRGYIGKRECKCLPENDTSYFGSYKDESFSPTSKIILSSFDCLEDALEAECILHEFFEVDVNPHFANRAKQTSSSFFYNKGPGEEAIERRREFMRTSLNPMSNPEYREKARLNLIASLKKPGVRDRKSASAKEAFSRPEVRRKRSEMATLAHQNPEVKRKHIECKLGSRNPCFGKRWVTNGVVNKYINGEDDVPPGFWYGRVL